MTDLTYIQDKMFTRFTPETDDGVTAWNEMAKKMNGVAAVLNCEAHNVITQLRKAGYKFRKSTVKKVTKAEMDQIYKELDLLGL